MLKLLVVFAALAVPSVARAGDQPTPVVVQKTPIAIDASRQAWFAQAVGHILDEPQSAPDDALLSDAVHQPGKR